ncbi:MAG: adenylate/guanylate cyclase domain-containing protein [Pseudomonadota bacterium]
MERRLAAIFAADMVGFSRLMEADEMGTIARQKRHRAELIDPKVEQHGGKIIKLTGDGMIAEFPSVVEAVQCAVSIQSEMAAREADVQDDRKIRYRVAVNLGDVLFDAEENDVYGDGVNIAARLEGLAEPGGVVVSGTAYDHLKANVEVGYQDLGERQVKNIATPVRVYKVVPNGATGLTIQPAPKLKNWRMAAMATAVVIALVAAGAGWYFSRPDFARADPEKMALALPGTPSIAVMPFRMSGASPEEHSWLADSLTDQIVSTIATASSADNADGFNILVIGRRSTKAYADATPAEIAQSLGVRHVLDADVVTVGGVLVVTARLLDTLDGRIVWSQQYDVEMDAESLIHVQNDLVARIFTEFQVEVAWGEFGRPFFETLGDFEAIRLGSQANAALSRGGPEGIKAAFKYSNELLEKRPNNIIANGFLGWVHAGAVINGVSQDSAHDLGEAEKYGARALEMDPEFGWSHGLVAWIAVLKREFDKALHHANRSHELSGDASLPVLGVIFLSCGEYERAEKFLTWVRRTQPVSYEWVPLAHAVSLQFLGRNDEAKEINKLYFDSENPRLVGLAYRNLISIAVSEGKIEEAKSLAEDLAATGSRFNSIKLLIGSFRGLKDRKLVKKIEDALRLAGVPEG